MSVAVLGNSVAALVATHRLAAEGVRTHLISPSSHFGGHFAGLTIDGESFDLGMVLLEFTAFNASTDADITSYRAEVRGDCGRFCSHIRRFVEVDLGIEIRRVETPSMVFGGEWSADLVISNELAVLQQLGSDTAQRMREELVVCTAHGRGALHAAHKKRWSAADGPNFESVSRANHGPTFHELFIDPLCHKITGMSCSEVAARLHRGAWLPLYYPETLSASLAAHPTALMSTEFHAPSAGSVVTLVERLVESVHASSSVDVTIDTLSELEPETDGAQLRLQSGRTLEVDHVVWALPPVADDSTAEERASIGFGFVLVDSCYVNREFSTVHLLDDEYAAYRMTNQTAHQDGESSRAQIVIEYNVDVMRTRSDTSAAVAAEIRRMLNGLRIVTSDVADVAIHIREFENVLPLPTVQNDRLHADRARRRIAPPCVSYVGAAAPFGSTSLNDQIVQGLRLGEILSHRQEVGTYAS